MLYLWCRKKPFPDFSCLKTEENNKTDRQWSSKWLTIFTLQSFKKFDIAWHVHNWEQFCKLNDTCLHIYYPQESNHNFLKLCFKGLIWLHVACCLSSLLWTQIYLTIMICQLPIGFLMQISFCICVSHHLVAKFCINSYMNSFGFTFQLAVCSAAKSGANN